MRRVSWPHSWPAGGPAGTCSAGSSYFLKGKACPRIAGPNRAADGASICGQIEEIGPKLT